VTYTYLAPGATTPTTVQGNGVDSSVTLPPGATQLRVTAYQIHLPQGFGGALTGADGLSTDPSCN
jgi:hypothetical protein